jgi:hypothetical protein
MNLPIDHLLGARICRVVRGNVVQSRQTHRRARRADGAVVLGSAGSADVMALVRAVVVHGSVGHEPRNCGVPVPAGRVASLGWGWRSGSRSGAVGGIGGT